MEKSVERAMTNEVKPKTKVAQRLHKNGAFAALGIIKGPVKKPGPPPNSHLLVPTARSVAPTHQPALSGRSTPSLHSAQSTHRGPASITARPTPKPPTWNASSTPSRNSNSPASLCTSTPDTPAGSAGPPTSRPPPRSSRQTSQTTMRGAPPPARPTHPRTPIATSKNTSTPSKIAAMARAMRASPLSRQTRDQRYRGGIVKLPQGHKYTGTLVELRKLIRDREERRDGDHIPGYSKLKKDQVIAALLEDDARKKGTSSGVIYEEERSLGEDSSGLSLSKSGAKWIVANKLDGECRPAARGATWQAIQK